MWFQTEAAKLPILAVSAGFLMLSSLSGLHAAGVGDQSDALSASETALVDNMDIEDDDPPIYIPPVTGAPGDRIGAGTRGTSRQASKMTLLAPKGGGLTLSEAPRLYWWLSEDFTGDVEIRIKSSEGERPILNMKRAVTAQSGLQMFDMSEFGLSLSEGQVYTWTIQMVGPGGTRVSNGTSFIERQSADNSVSDQDAVGRARSLAASGYWYDALAMLADDPKMAKLRAGLLESAGLKLQTPK